MSRARSTNPLHFVPVAEANPRETACGVRVAGQLLRYALHLEVFQAWPARDRCPTCAASAAEPTAPA